MNKRRIACNLLKRGFSRKTIYFNLKIGSSKLNSFISHLPSPGTVQDLLKDSNFEKRFKKLYYSKDTLKVIIAKLKKEPIFKRKSISQATIIRLRNFYGLKKRMHENSYNSKEDRIKGYIIRNSKHSAKRRGNEFNLHYTDIELPTHCPLLGIELDYLQEGDFNLKNHASLDRIDNTKGYIKGNVMVISRLANAMKNEANFEQLETFCNNISLLLKFFKNQDALGSITDIFPNINLKK